MIDFIFKGFLVSGSLIIAIGSQNAFFKTRFIETKYILCFLNLFFYDFLLMSIGVFGLGGWVNNYSLAINMMAISGAIYLFLYGFMALSLFIVHIKGIVA